MSWRLTVVAAGVVASGPVWSLEPDALFAKVEPSVWTVLASDAQGRSGNQGSAVVIGPGRLVTNCHVLARMTRVQVVKANVSYGAKLEFPDPENDLCQLRVDNFNAPAVELAAQDTLRVGARVYAIGTPQGMETTLSDGLLSGLRRDGSGQLVFVQTTAPISPGSSGGGLFDSEGHLIGITTFSRREAQNINLAVPSYRIPELAERGRQHLEQRQAARAAGPVAAAPATPAGSAELSAQRQPGDWFDYVITDHYTQVKQTVNLRVDRVLADRVIFNGGTRVEGLDGKVLESQPMALAELDMVTPPGGWSPGGQVMRGVRQLRITTTWQNHPATYDLTAVASPEQTLRVGDAEYSAVRIDLNGWLGRNFASNLYSMPYRATVWYAPALQRVVRFTVEFRSPLTNVTVHTAVKVNETLELARAGRD